MRRLLVLLIALALPALAAPPVFAPVTPLAAGQSLKLPHDFGATRLQDGMVVRHRLGKNRQRRATGLPGDLLSQRHRL